MFRLQFYLIFVKGIKVDLNLLSYALTRDCSFLLLFVNKAIFIPCDYGLCFFAKDHLTVFMWTHFWTLHFDPLEIKLLLNTRWWGFFVTFH